MSVNKNYKASLFSLLFSDPDVLRELYSALEGVNLPADVPVIINTLQDVLFMSRVNDISFEIGGKLVVLIEHQSTINPNMALRLLMYIARVYEKIIGGDKNIYSRKRVSIPRPEFFVLYNGTEAYPDEKTLKLSESFEESGEFQLPWKEVPALELVVKVVNINYGRNGWIVERSKTLSEYIAFIGKAREYEKEGLDREEVLKKAVNYCRTNNILKDFLEEHGTEVINMLMTEWNWDDALAVRYSEGMEEGIEKGIEKGREDVARKALAEGASPEFVQKITGLDMQIIERLMQS